MRFMMYLLPNGKLRSGLRVTLERAPERVPEKETLQATSLQTTSVPLRVLQ
jgi:hypothetical protein